MLNLQLQQQNMSSADLTLEEFPHFKTQWQPSSNCYKHIYSSDLCELRLLRRIHVKELDLYSSREAYSFPFCPHVYKYSIERNELIDNQIAFDIKLLLEHVPNRLSETPSNEQLIPKTIDLLRGLEYLRLRFGPFRIKKGMVGWTALGLAKVWINQDFSMNLVEEKAMSEQEMLEDLYSMFPECETFNLLKKENLNSLNSMIDFIEENQIKKNQPLIKKKALKQIQNFDNSEHSFDRQIYKELPETNSNKSRKNITFSYSNKNLDNKSTRKVHNANKRNSIALVDDDFRADGVSGLSRIPPRKGLAFGNGHQSSSLKIIHQKKSNQQQKKMSVFRPLGSETQEEDRVKIKKLSEYFGMAQKNLENQVPKIGDIYRHSVQEKPVYLHFSTSSNPYNELVSNQAKEVAEFGERSLSSNNQFGQNVSTEGKEGQDEEINPLEQELTEFTIGQKNYLEAEQVVKDDLDALFNSDHQFDYGQLQNDLDHVLF